MWTDNQPRVTAESVRNLKAAFAENDIPWPKAQALFWHPTGALVKYGFGFLWIENLNPEVKTRWRMSRGEMLRFGWRCIWAALSAGKPGNET